MTFDEYCKENTVIGEDKEEFLEFVCEEQNLDNDTETPRNATKEEFDRLYNSFVEDDDFAKDEEDEDDED